MRKREDSMKSKEKKAKRKFKMIRKWSSQPNVKVIEEKVAKQFIARETIN